MTGLGPRGSSGEESNVTVTALALTVDRCCAELRRGGWAAEEVVEILGALLGPRKARRAAAALPPDVAARVNPAAPPSRAPPSPSTAWPPGPCRPRPRPLPAPPHRHRRCKVNAYAQRVQTMR